MVGDADPNTVANHPTRHQPAGDTVTGDDDTSLWLLTDLAACTTCWLTLQPYTCARRRFYVCFCFTLNDAQHLEALVVGHAAAHDRRTATERPFITYQRWHQATRADLRQHLLRLVDHALVHTPRRVDLRWHPQPAATAVYQP
ncbi:hypothetical protein [Micromonospora aurantiaca (nom. illeg.)]|uniref:hypothetical protein n=1 Tax=Micromonospora aurantiaca (nom. illeg.) TaxID=47850 RepID=UPI0001BF5711|nr:hypothetical protein [Micromonospora aurantiaca]ADL47612.1 hypothetical protein Micau_4096 [Micromonospora aurantiaca ATCC 27029]